MTLQDLLDDEYDEGMTAGIEKGRKLSLISQVEKKLAKGKSIEEIADALEEDEDVILEIIKEINKE